MELRVHGGPALLFPSFRETLCWERFLHTVNQLLLLGSAGLGVSFGSARLRSNEGDAVEGLQIPGSAGKSGCVKAQQLVSITGVPGGAGEHSTGWGVGRALCWGIGEDAEGTTGKAGRCGGSWNVCAGDFG